MKLLLVEKDDVMRSGIVSYLRRQGYIIEKATDFHTARLKINTHEYDCVIIDTCLPKGCGFELMKMLKRSFPETGVIVTSNITDLDFRIEVLRRGADDFIIKPYDTAELDARIVALVRRCELRGRTEIKINDISIDPEGRVVKVNGTPVDLTPKEFGLLMYFVTHRNRVLTHEMIAEHLGGDYMGLSADSFDFIYTHVKNLRRKLSKSALRKVVRTVYGVGYKLV